ncbi:MAG: TIGR01620 family protein, partial [Pseudomonadota bacterium]
VAAYDFVTGLVARSPILGAAALGILAVFVLVCLALIVRELAALARLRRVGALQAEAVAARAGSLDEARAFADRLCAFYAARDETRWGRDKLKDGAAQAFDPGTVLLLAEDVLLDPLDQQAMREVEAAARQVATITALVPMAFADVLAALTSNLTMIRRIAEIYGGRAGTLGAWRLTRAVITHLVATGAVAIGDDLLGSVGGGHLLGKLSRRFGEGLVNGALTARVGIAAMEVCRPVPFSETRKPGVAALVRRAFTGLFEKSAE